MAFTNNKVEEDEASVDNASVTAVVPPLPFSAGGGSCRDNDLENVFVMKELSNSSVFFQSCQVGTVVSADE